MSSMALQGVVTTYTISNVDPTVVGSGVVSTPLPLETFPVDANGGGRGELHGLRRDMTKVGRIITTTTIHETLTATGISNLALPSMQHHGPSKTLEAAERPTSLPSSSSSSISRETKVGFGVGVSLGFLILVSIIILAFRIGRKTGMSSAAAKKARSFQGLSRLSGAWFRKSGFGKAELCAESQQIFEIGSGKSEVKVGELEANTKIVKLEGDDVGGDEAVQSEKSFV